MISNIFLLAGIPSCLGKKSIIPRTSQVAQVETLKFITRKMY
jgi:hypothetical protein